LAELVTISGRAGELGFNSFVGGSFTWISGNQTSLDSLWLIFSGLR
jgi:hypothetical protein